MNKSFYILLFLIPSLASAQQVNEFTGDFSHGVPLLTLPSPDGSGIPISASYQAGIGVNQGASELGLGWALGAGGAITRSVSGIPDDWKNITTFNTQKNDFVSHWGTIYFKDYTSGMLDFNYSTYKLDTPRFHFPDYDYYSVSGPGIGGSLQPRFMDYSTTVMSTNDTEYGKGASNWFTKKPQFTFSGDFSGNLDPRHYPSPISGSTAIKLPGDQTGGSSDPYGGGGYQSSYNRLIAPGFVEYFTNNEINGGLTNFLDYKTGSTRTSADFDMDGVGAFRITDGSGNVYHYSLPVYINYTINGMYPLENNYDTLNYDTLGTTNHSSGSYRIKLFRMNDSVLVEYKQNARYAYAWLLTAVTGPDYKDLNANKIPDESDKGYWIRYDWEKWTNNFYSRTPQYGGAYSFSPNDADSIVNGEKMITDPTKENGKYLTFSASSQQIYYLNTIRSSSHTVAFVRDLRNDEHAQSFIYDTQKPGNVNLPSSSGTGPTQNSSKGFLYDHGGPNSGPSQNGVDAKITIAPTGAEKVKVFFRMCNDACAQDTIFIYDGPDENSSLVATVWGNAGAAGGPVLDSAYTSTNDTITFRLKMHPQCDGPNLKAEWQVVNPTIPVVPQLKLSKIILFENNNFSVKDSGRAFTSASQWNLDSTTSASKKIYNVNWYTDFKTTIDSLALKMVEFTQDYLLSRKYYDNVKTAVKKSFRFTPPDRVRDSVTVSGSDYNASGKLTLNKIVSFEQKKKQLYPSHVFEYDTAVVLNNPDYNPIAIDNWGMYKIDISSKGYTSYVTDSSDAYTDAWSMRKITLPAGGTVEIEYESDEYEKVLNDSIGGGFRGPMRTYHILDVTARANNLAAGDTTGNTWQFTLEDDVNDFWSLVNSPPSGTIRKSFIPFTTRNTTPDSCFDNTETYLNQGSGSISQSGSNYKIKDLRFYRSSIGQNAYSTNTLTDYFTSSPNNCDSTHLVCTGNGYISFELPAGTLGKVYGGGIRVKSISTKNSTTDTYKTTYTYSEGVATGEADRFDKATQKKDYGGTLVYTKLRSYNGDKHKLPPQVGYTKVTVKNLGQTVSTANGEVTYTFATSDAGYDNFETTKVLKTEATRGSVCGGCPAFDTDTVYLLEVRNKFSSRWGAPLEVETKDINGNILSKTINDYIIPSLGTATEYFHFRTEKTKSCPPTCTSKWYTSSVSILREYPMILSKQTVYSKGLKSTTEYFNHDSITGAALKVKVTDATTGVGIAESTPAYKITTYQKMGAKSKDTTYKNIVSADAEIKTIRDSSIVGGTNDFAGYSVSVWNDTLTIRQYNNETDKYENIIDNGYYWRTKKNYSWTGSLGRYGLFRGDSLVAYNHSASSNNTNWRFGSEVTLIDKKGHVLETKGFNDRYGAAKYGHYWKFNIATAANSNYASFTHTSFEDTITENGTGYFGGEVKKDGGVYYKSDATVTAHTGNYCVKVPQNTNGPIYKVKYNAAGENVELQRGRTYRAGVWVHASSPSTARLILHLDGSSSAIDSMQRNDPDTIRIGDWILLTAEVTVPSNYTSSGGTNNDLRIYVKNPSGSGADAYFDDMRLQAVDAVVTATVYDEITGRVLATLDNNNMATTYQYDEGGRVTKVFIDSEKGGRVKVKQNAYNYARGTN